MTLTLSEDLLDAIHELLIRSRDDEVDLLSIARYGVGRRTAGGQSAECKRKHSARTMPYIVLASKLEEGRKVFGLDVHVGRLGLSARADAAARSRSAVPWCVRSGNTFSH